MREATLDYPGRIKNIRDVENFSQLIEFILPYGFAKIYMTAGRRWAFLEKNRRREARALLLNVVIRRFGFNIWDVRTSGGGFLEDFHTMPVIGIISSLIREFAAQEGLVKDSTNFTMATFQLCGAGYISPDLKVRIDRLHELKMRRDRNLAPAGRKSGTPFLYKEAVKTLYELEESLLAGPAAEDAKQATA